MLRKLGPEVKNQLNTTIRKNPLWIYRRCITLQSPEALHKTAERRLRYSFAVTHLCFLWLIFLCAFCGLRRLPDTAVGVLYTDEDDLFRETVVLFEVEGGDAD